MNKVGVVILNYKAKEEILECITSLQKTTYKNLSIIVVDNNSGDGLGAEMKKLPDIEFIQTGDNLGYSGGNNVGINKALSSGVDFVFILNADTWVEKDTITKLVASLEKNQVGIAAPKVLFADKKTIWYAGGVFDFANVLGSHRGVDEIDRGQYDREEETTYASGGAMMVKREVFEKVGLFDEKYFLYYEDSDFSLRVREAGFKILYAPKAVVFHHNAKSAGLGSPLQDYFITRNRMLFAAKFLPLRTRFALLREAIGNINSRVRRLALYDFLIGNFGKGSFLE